MSSRLCRGSTLAIDSLRHRVYFHLHQLAQRLFDVATGPVLYVRDGAAARMVVSIWGCKTAAPSDREILFSTVPSGIIPIHKHACIDQ